MKPYNPSNIPLAKELRKNMTPWESKLWYNFLRSYPVRFQRQKAIGDYIADFYCAKSRLVIELDGGGHYAPEQAQRDALSTQQLQSMNLTVLRICNLDVDQNFHGVCEYIDMVVQDSLPQSASLTAPSSEGASGTFRKNQRIFALGFFDGVHLGHQALLKACRELATALGVQAGAVTFDPHPGQLVSGQCPRLINCLDDRRRLLERCGAEHIHVFPFDDKFRTMPWQDFFWLLTKDYGAAGFVCGDDFRFGYRGQGNAMLLRGMCRTAGIPCIIVPAQELNGTRISSTHIRTLLEAGDMASANRFLGHPHILTGEVVAGRQLGRTLGIPTANLHIPEGVVVPRHGVYACKAFVEGKEYLAVTNIGSRPTVGGHRVTVEPWLLDFDGDLYGKTLMLEFYEFLRPEQKFDSLEALQAEIRKNALQTRKIFEKS